MECLTLKLVLLLPIHSVCTLSELLGHLRGKEVFSRGYDLMVVPKWTNSMLSLSPMLQSYALLGAASDPGGQLDAKA